MSRFDVAELPALKEAGCLLCRYFPPSFVELVSRLDEAPAPGRPGPHRIYRACVRKLKALCEREVLPSPEVAFPSLKGLGQVWRWSNFTGAPYGGPIEPTTSIAEGRGDIR